MGTNIYIKRIKSLHKDGTDEKNALHKLILIRTLLDYVNTNKIRSVSYYRIPLVDEDLYNFWEKEWIAHIKSSVNKSDIDEAIIELSSDSHFIYIADQKGIGINHPITSQQYRQKAKFVKISSGLLKLLTYSEVREIFRSCIISELDHIG